MNRVLVTGANGFIGSGLYGSLRKKYGIVVGAVRQADLVVSSPYDRLYSVGNISSRTDWSQCLENVDVVIHLAAQGPGSRKGSGTRRAEDPMEVNFLATRELVRQALKNKVKRFVYVSSIGVLGSETSGAAFDDYTNPNPSGLYSISKLQAENEVKLLSEESDLEYVIVRPPTVYGPGATGNYARLTNAITNGLPLPLGSIRNCRSMISVTDLCDFLAIVSTHQNAKDESFVVAEDKGISTPDLVRLICWELKRKTRMFRFPVTILQVIGALIGESRAVNSVCNSLVVDSSRARLLLNWIPKKALVEHLKRPSGEYARGFE